MRSILTRIVLLVVTVWLILTVGYVCIYRLPGDPARIILGRQASEETLQAYRARAGLDLPLWRQYETFVWRVAHLDFGDSLLYRRPVSGLLRERSTLTLRLVCLALLESISLAFVFPIGFRLVGMQRVRKWLQNVSTALGVAPPYVLGVTSLAVFAGWLAWVSPIFEPMKSSAWIMPSLVLAAYPTAVTMRLFNNQLDTVLHAPYIVRAKAMGFPYRTILVHEALPNAMTAALAALANGLAAFWTGTFFVEVIFGIGGLGQLTYEAISNKDIALLAALCLVFAIGITVISATLEVCQLLLDPRLRENRA